MTYISFHSPDSPQCDSFPQTQTNYASNPYAAPPAPYGSPRYEQPKTNSAFKKTAIIVSCVLAMFVGSAAFAGIASAVSEDSSAFNCWIHGNKRCGRPAPGHAITHDGKYIKLTTKKPAARKVQPKPKAKVKPATKTKPRVKPVPVPAPIREELGIPKSCWMIIGDTTIIVCPDGRTFTS